VVLKVRSATGSGASRCRIPGQSPQRREEALDLLKRQSIGWRVALHMRDEVVLRDMADNAAEIRGADSLSKEKTEIGIAEHVWGDFVGEIERGIVCRVEDEPSDLLNR
jgi:hypothetical protein